MNIGSSVFNSMRKKYFKTFTTNFVSYVYGYMLLLMFWCAYIIPHVYNREIEVSYGKCKKIYDAMRGAFSIENVNIRRCLLEIVLKTVVMDLMLLLLTGRSFVEGSQVPSVTIVLLFPLPLAIRLHFNVFYGALLALSIHFKDLNEKLDEIMSIAKLVHRQSHLNERSYNLNDRVDAIAISYCRLTEATKSINEIFSVSTTLGHTLFVISLTTQSLIMFVRMADVVQQGGSFLLNGTRYAYIVVIFCDIFTSAYFTERLVKEVRIALITQFNQFRTTNNKSNSRLEQVKVSTYLHRLAFR